MKCLERLRSLIARKRHNDDGRSFFDLTGIVHLGFAADPGKFAVVIKWALTGIPKAGKTSDRRKFGMVECPEGSLVFAGKVVETGEIEICLSFAGRSRNLLMIDDAVYDSGHGSLGSLFASLLASDPRSRFRIDCPTTVELMDRPMPFMADVNLVAYAFSLHVAEQSEGGHRLFRDARESCSDMTVEIPDRFFMSDSKVDRSGCLFTGEVVEVLRLRNSLTKVPFACLMVDSSELAIDVIVDSRCMPNLPDQGDIVMVAARLVENIEIEGGE